MNRCRSILSVLIALWLPLQGYGAIVMPFCQQHGMATGGASHSEPSHEHHSGHSGHGIHEDPSADPAGIAHSEQGGGDATNGLACNNCGACHLACSPAISAIAVAAVLIGDSILEPLPADSLHFFYPEQLQRPPLSALL